MSLFRAQKVAQEGGGDPVSVSEVPASDWNAAFVDEDGDTAFGTAGAVAALSALSVVEIQKLDGLGATQAELDRLDDSAAAVFAAGTIVPRAAQAKYDITGGDDGTVGAHGLGVNIPADSIIIGGIIDVTETFTDGADDSATIALHVQSANDIVSAIAISDVSAPWAQGLQAAIPVWTAASAVKVGSSAKEITATVADDEIDSGSMTITLFYVPTEVDAG